MGKHQRKSQSKLAKRQNDYDDNYSSDGAWKRPGSQNLKKRTSIAQRRGGRR